MRRRTAMRIGCKATVGTGLVCALALALTLQAGVASAQSPPLSTPVEASPAQVDETVYVAAVMSRSGDLDLYADVFWADWAAPDSTSATR
jgi:hypothetical protein